MNSNKSPALFGIPNPEEKSESRVKLILELSNLIDTTIALLEIHNKLVSRMHEIQHEILEHKSELETETKSPTTLKEKIKILKEQETVFANTLGKTRSSDILKENFRRIEELHNQLFPEDVISFSSPVNLQKLKRKT